jgi:hypothetical protein
MFTLSYMWGSGFHWLRRCPCLAGSYFGPDQQKQPERRQAVPSGCGQKRLAAASPAG